LADSAPQSNAEIFDELASIVIRGSDLIQLAATGRYNSRSPKKIAKRLRRMGKHKEADDLEMLVDRAEELKSASSDSS
jgi:hypothetical protein